jgi:hypothetical protein
MTMDNVELVWSDGRAEVHRFVVGPIENNVYVVRCKRTGEATLLGRGQRTRPVTARRTHARASLRSSRPTDTGTTSAPSSRSATRASTYGCAARDAGMLPSYDHLLDDDTVHRGRRPVACARLHTPGHTPGSICFALEETPMLFTGDTLFPGRTRQHQSERPGLRHHHHLDRRTLSSVSLA